MLIATPDSLELQHQENAAKVKEQALVKDVTTIEKPPADAVTDTANNSNLGYNKDAKEMLQNNLNNEEKIIAQNLENERLGVKGDNSKSGDVAKKISKAEETFDSITGEYSSLRVFDKIDKDGNKLLGIKRENNEDKK